MSVITGSQGAGQTGYALVLRNRSAAACAVSGVPALRLLGAAGKPLPSNVVSAQRGVTYVLVVLRAGGVARSRVRFSPDIPGPGEPQTRACEPTVHKVRVTLASPGHGSLLAPVVPPTPVCEHGRMVVSGLTRG
jgi:hypothetical protein